MTKTNLLKSCQLLLIANIVFWLLTAVYFSFFKFATNDNYFILKILLFAEPVLYSLSLVGIVKRIKIIYLFSILLTFGNTILSITDQMGIYDYLSLGLSILAFLNLLLLWRTVFSKL